MITVTILLKKYWIKYSNILYHQANESGNTIGVWVPHGGEINVQSKEARPDDPVKRVEASEFVIHLSS